MTVYFDSSALVPVYVNEVHSARARSEVRKNVRIPWTPLHDLEVRNALRLLRGRGHINGEELHALLSHVDHDLDEGRLERPAIDLGALFQRAGRLSEAHAGTTPARTLDILHIGAALELGCTTMVSGDERQLRVATAEQMHCVDIRKRRR